MLEKSGIEAIPSVPEAAPEAKVLVLSMVTTLRNVREAFAAGASGYVLKEAVDAEVVLSYARWRTAAATSIRRSAHA